MKFFPNTSIRRKETLIIMATTSVALLLVGAALTVFEIRTFRQQMADNLSTCASIAGNDVSAALDFNDASAATETLSALKAEPGIIGACVYSPDGSIFAQYARKGTRFTPPKKVQRNGDLFRRDNLALFQPIESNGQVIGVIYLESDTQELRSRLTQFSIITLIVFLVTLLISLGLSNRLQRVISGPILDLVRVTREVAQNRNYSIRVQQRSNDEIGVLIAGFNEMLAQIQERDRNLERRVAERTEELMRENRERRDSQAQYRSLVEQLPAGIFRKDAEGRYVFANSGFCQLRGISLEQILGKTADELAATATDEHYLQLLREGAEHHAEIMRTGKPIQMTEEYPGTNGQPRHLQVTKTPVHGAEGNMIGTQGILVDITERKRAEAALAHERDLLNMLLNNSKDRIYFKDLESRFARCSASMAAMFGAEKSEDLIGKRDHDFFTSEHADQALEDERAIIRTGQPLIGKVEKETWPDGHESWVLTSKMPLRNETSEIVGTFGISKDITAIKLAEAALARERDLLNTLLNSSEDKIYFKDLESRFTRCSASMVQRFRVSKIEDLIGKTDRDFFFDGHAEDALADERKIIQTGKALIDKVEKVTWPDGRVTWAFTSKMPLRSETGEIVGTFGISKDITAIKLAEAELSRERNLLRTVITNSPDNIYIKDTHSRKLMVNPAEMKNMGCQTEAEAVGKTDFDIFPKEFAERYFADDQSVLQSGEPLINREEKVVRPDGEVRWLLSSKFPLRDAEGKIIGLVGMGRDITAIREAKVKLEEANRRLVDASRQAGMAEVATSVLHNVGNVLNSANVSASLIADKMKNSKVKNVGKVADLMREHERDVGGFLANDPKGKQLPEYLCKLAEHLAQEQEEVLKEIGSLVNNIVHIKEIVTMQQGYAKASGVLESFKVTDLVEDALRMNSGAMDRHNVRIIREFAEVPSTMTDKHKVLQILINLIRNAKYACDDSGRADKQITLRVDAHGSQVKITVIDNGIGIAPENLTRIFNHGFTTRKDGHGFGLHSGAIAAQEMGGALTAFSEGIGCGATFMLELPMTPSQNNYSL